LEFSQALNPSASLDTTHVHVLALPDSTPVPIDKILTQRQFDSLATAARQKAESAAAVARDTTRRPPPPPPPPPQAAPTQPARGAALRAAPGLTCLLAAHPRALVVKAARATVDAARVNGGAAPAEGWDAAVRAAVARLAVPSLAPVINATGVVLHTNLGRAPLAHAAIAAITRVAQGYSALEYDIGRGTRGSRHAHCRDLLVELTGAADGLVVNNAAGAVLLALSALARGGDA